MEKKFSLKNIKFTKNHMIIASIVLVLIVGVVSLGFFLGKSAYTIELDYGETYLEFGKRINIPDATVFDREGVEIAYDAVCVSVMAPDGTEVDISTGVFTPMQIGDYEFTYMSESKHTETVMDIECKDTIDPTVSIEVEEAYMIKETYESETYTTYALPVITADDLAGIDSSKTEVKITLADEEVKLNGDEFTFTKEGPVLFEVTVYDMNGRSASVTAESRADMPEDFPKYCLSTFAKESYKTKLCGGWLNSYYEATILESDTDSKGNKQEGVLKITYDASDREAGACIHLGRPVKVEDIDSLDITLRIDGGVKKVDDLYTAIFYKSNYKDGYWSTANTPLFVGTNYETVKITSKSVLKSMADEDGYIRQFQIETFGDQETARNLYLADISYTPAGMGGSSADGGAGTKFAELKDNYPKYCLSTFALDAYKDRLCGGWLKSAYTASILKKDTDSAGNTQEGVLKITYPAKDKEAGACIHLGRGVKVADVESLDITLRIDGGVKMVDDLYTAIFYKSDYTKGYWTTSNTPVKVGTTYQTVKITNKNVLSAMADTNGYIRQLQIETFGDEKSARNIYIADISYTPVSSAGAGSSANNTGDLQDDFPKYCLSTFALPAYADRVCGGWLPDRPFVAGMLNKDTDAVGTTKEGVLKITYGTSVDENAACIHLGRAVKAEDVESLDITLRLDGDVRTVDNKYNIIFFKANAGKQGPWGLGNIQMNKVGENYETVKISDRELLKSMADSDGYIRQIQIETFGTKAGERNLYLADISYTPVDRTIYTVTVTGGTADIAGAVKGTTITLTLDESLIPTDGTFDCWKVNGEKIDGNTFVLTQNTTVEAVYVMPEVFPDYVLSTFARDSYARKLTNGWLSSVPRKYKSAEILETDKDSKDVSKEGVLKITYDKSWNEYSTYMELGRPVHVDDIHSLEVTLRIDGDTRTVDSNRNIVFYSANAGRDGLYTSGAKTKNAIVGADYTTVSITNKDLLKQMADSDGMIRYIAIEVFSNQRADLNVYLSDICYTEKQYTVTVTGGTADVTSGVEGTTVTLTVDEGLIPNGGSFDYWTVNGDKIDGHTFTLTEDVVVEAVYQLPEVFPDFVLSTFGYEIYKSKLTNGWLSSVPRKFKSAEIMETDTDSKNVSKEGVLKITYDKSWNEYSTYIELGRSVCVDDIDSLQVTLRIDGDTRTVDANRNIVFYSVNAGRDGLYTSGAKTQNAIVGVDYTTISITNKALLKQMADSDGMIRHIAIEVFGNQQADLHVYLAEIGYTANDVLASYNNAEIASQITYGWLSNRTGTANVLASDTDSNNVTKNGVLKLTFGTSFDEFSPCIPLEKPVKASDVASLDITLRLGGDIRTIDGTYNILFYKANTTGPWGINSMQAKLGENYETVKITDKNLITAMADSDGYIRKINLEVFSSKQADLNVYISDINYTKITNE